ncbi:hypothetical protein HOM50_01105 [bacterium]|jgi:hypothetical protein|nr:hypothetical protein [bacterium]MBT5014989.1 hypothetical protein [bacterium]
MEILKKLILLLLLLSTTSTSPLTEQTQERILQGIVMGASPAILTYTAWSYLKNGDFSPTTGKMVVVGLMGMTGATLGGLTKLATSSDALFQAARFSTLFTDPLLINEELSEEDLIEKAKTNIPTLPLMGADTLLEANMTTLMGSSLLFFLCQQQDQGLEAKCDREMFNIMRKRNRASRYREIFQQNQEFQRELASNLHQRTPRPDEEETSLSTLWNTYVASNRDLQHLHGYNRNLNN